MNASIEAGDDDGCAVKIIDNLDNEHWIEIKFDEGDITYHESSDYTDKASDRTPERNEYVEQARRFARYYVYLERGYDTVRPDIHPERIEAVRASLSSLSTSEFGSLFGDLYDQVMSHHTDTEPTVDVPEAVPNPDNVLYCQRIYLGFDPLESPLPDRAASLADEYGLDLTSDHINAADSPSTDLNDWQSFLADLTERAALVGIDLSDGLEIGAVSSPYVTYIDDQGYEQSTEPQRDLADHEPDTILELTTDDPGSLEEFQKRLNVILICQIRDCFVRMGIEPPEPYRVLGAGRFEATEAYERLDIYPDYHKIENENISW